MEMETTNQPEMKMETTGMDLSYCFRLKLTKFNSTDEKLEVDVDFVWEFMTERLRESEVGSVFVAEGLRLKIPVIYQNDSVIFACSFDFVAKKDAEEFSCYFTGKDWSKVRKQFSVREPMELLFSWGKPNFDSLIMLIKPIPHSDPTPLFVPYLRPEDRSLPMHLFFADGCASLPSTSQQPSVFQVESWGANKLSHSDVDTGTMRGYRIPNAVAKMFLVERLNPTQMEKARTQGLLIPATCLVNGKSYTLTFKVTGKPEYHFRGAGWSEYLKDNHLQPNEKIEFSWIEPGKLGITLSARVPLLPLRVLVSGCTGPIGCAVVPMIATGNMLGADEHLILQLLDMPEAAQALSALKMELVDAAFPLLKGVVATTDVVEACKGVNVAVMVGGFPRKEGMERKDVMSKNVSIYRTQASALEQHAAPNCKVLVVANPASTIALILKTLAPSIPEKNITCLTRLYHNRALGQISQRLNVQVSDVKNVIILGNHSSSQYPDVNHATVNTPTGEKSVRELVDDDAWLNGEFISTVQHGRKLSSASACDHVRDSVLALSACDHIRDWVHGTREGTFVSMGVFSDGSYGVPVGMLYSFPVTCKDGEWKIVQGLDIDQQLRQRLDATGSAELLQELTLLQEITSAGMGLP